MKPLQQPAPHLQSSASAQVQWSGSSGANEIDLSSLKFVQEQGVLGRGSYGGARVFKGNPPPSP